MAFDLDGLLAAWTQPLPSDPVEARAVFERYYHDPVVVNGASMTVDDLVGRARAAQAMLDQREVIVLDSVDAADKVAVAFRMRGRQVGEWVTSLGGVAGTGAEFDLRVIDVLTIRDGRVSSLWMVSDELGQLVTRDAVTWKG